MSADYDEVIETLEADGSVLSDEQRAHIKRTLENPMSNEEFIRRVMEVESALDTSR